MKDTNSLSHTSYRCKYHIVIVPKYRRLIIYNKLRRDIIEILILLINRFKDVELIEGQACPDHIHMLLEIPPKYSICTLGIIYKNQHIAHPQKKNINPVCAFPDCSIPLKFKIRNNIINTIAIILESSHSILILNCSSNILK